jgi:hypothetical protein
MNGQPIPHLPDPEASVLDRIELELTAEEFPGLASFAAGYLHEELELEHGSAAGAAWAFCQEADLEEVAQAARGWELLELVGRERGAAAAALLLVGRFGSAWQPSESGDLERVGAELRRALEGWDE